MGNKSRERMTGLTVQGRVKRSVKKKEEEKEARHRARLAMIDLIAKRSKGHG